jgi:NAD dependent epimerase/dehydratase family enzyme
VLAKLPAGIGELVDNLLLASQRVLPGVLTDSGFTFSQPDLELALRAVLSA